MKNIIGFICIIALLAIVLIASNGCWRDKVQEQLEANLSTLQQYTFPMRFKISKPHNGKQKVEYQIFSLAAKDDEGYDDLEKIDPILSETLEVLAGHEIHVEMLYIEDLRIRNKKGKRVVLSKENKKLKWFFPSKIYSDKMESSEAPSFIGKYSDNGFPMNYNYLKKANGLSPELQEGLTEGYRSLVQQVEKGDLFSTSAKVTTLHDISGKKSFPTGKWLVVMCNSKGGAQCIEN